GAREHLREVFRRRLLAHRAPVLLAPRCTWGEGLPQRWRERLAEGFQSLVETLAQELRWRHEAGRRLVEACIDCSIARACREPSAELAARLGVAFGQYWEGLEQAERHDGPGRALQRLLHAVERPTEEAPEWRPSVSMLLSERPLSATEQGFERVERLRAAQRKRWQRLETLCESLLLGVVSDGVGSVSEGTQGSPDTLATAKLSRDRRSGVHSRVWHTTLANPERSPLQSAPWNAKAWAKLLVALKETWDSNQIARQYEGLLQASCGELELFFAELLRRSASTKSSRMQWLRARQARSPLSKRELQARRQRAKHCVTADPGLERFLNELYAQLRETHSALDLGLREDLVKHESAFAPLAEQLLQMSQALSSQDAPSEKGAAFLRVLTRLSRHRLKRLSHTIDRSVLPALEAYHAGSSLPEQLRSASTKLEQLPSLAPERLLIRPAVPGQPVLTLRLGRLVKQWQATGAMHRFADRVGQSNDFRTKTVELTHELWRMLRYNLEGALAEAEEALRNQLAEAEVWARFLEISSDGLHRAQQRLEEMRATIRQWDEALLESYDVAFELPRFVFDQAQASLLAKERRRFWWRELALVWASLKRSGAELFESGAVWTTRWYRRGLQGYASWGQAWRRALGLLEPPPLIEAEAQVVSAPRQLPAVYRRLFSLEALELEEFLVGREDGLRRLVQSYEAWLQGLRRPLLIHGQLRSGVRSFLNCGIDRLRAELPLLRLRLEQRVLSRQELLALFSAAGIDGLQGLEVETLVDERVLAAFRSSRRILLVENIHLLFVRQIGGFDLFLELLNLIGLSSEHVLWICSMQSHAHALLHRLYRIDERFFEVMVMASMSVEQTRELIERRHKVSGYHLRFVEEELSSAVQKKLKRVTEAKQRQRLLSDAFFEDIHHRADGNPLISIMYWLRSVELAEGQIVANFTAEADHRALERLGTEQLFALTAILQHGNLDSKQLAELFEWPLPKAFGILEQCSRLRICVPIDDGVYGFSTRHRIEMMVMPALLRLLQKKHLVYWKTS
ncbi:MAG: hypothetical protein RBU37_15850, partial [Myxococcota bacterium]|nr:hypothetical protein [Myxococcota bacterium]